MYSRSKNKLTYGLFGLFDLWIILHKILLDTCESYQSTYSSDFYNPESTKKSSATESINNNVF